MGNDKELAGIQICIHSHCSYVSATNTLCYRLYINFYVTTVCSHGNLQLHVCMQVTHDMHILANT